MIKEHTTALALAKQLNLAINHDADVEDMKYTLSGLLETGIKNASQMGSTHSISKKVRNQCYRQIAFTNAYCLGCFSQVTLSFLDL